MKLIIDIPEEDFNACKLWVEMGVASWQDKVITNGIPYEKECIIEELAKSKNEERPQGEWIEFADFIARNVVSEDFSEDVDFYAEVLCRKLVKLGLVKLDGDTYKYCGADMRA